MEMNDHFDLDFRSTAKIYVLINKATIPQIFHPSGNQFNCANYTRRERMSQYRQHPWYHSQDWKIEKLKHDSSNSKIGELRSGAFSQTRKLFFVNSKMAVDPQDLSC